MVPSIHSICSRLLPAVLATGLLTITSTASAQRSAPVEEPALPPSPSPTPGPTPEALAQAKVHYQNALDHHGHKEYQAAAREYEKAFELFPNPEFVFNAAQVYRLDGKVRVALEKYQRYLALDSEGRGAGDARAHIASLKIELARIEKDDRERAQAEKERLAEEKRQADEDRRLDRERSAALLRADLVARDPGNRTLRIAGLATAGVGLVGLALGGKFALDAKGLEQDVTGNTIWSKKDFEDGQDAERNAYLFFGVGGAAVVGGAILYWFGRPGRPTASSETQLSIVPLSSHQGGGLALEGNF